jgi:hypothetical protein
MKQYTVTLWTMEQRYENQTKEIKTSEILSRNQYHGIHCLIESKGKFAPLLN